jgi:cytoskeletal protein CcmA (bactofilin family)
MWKKDEARSAEISPANSGLENAENSPVAATNSRFAVPPISESSRSSASISKGIRIVGEVVGREDLFVDGTVEGSLIFENCSVTVGPNGNVRADVSAREVIVRGKIEGKVVGSERVVLQGTGEIAGEVKTEKLSIEEGGVLRGKVESGKPAPPVQPVRVKIREVEVAVEQAAVSTESVAE